MASEEVYTSSSHAQSPPQAWSSLPGLHDRLDFLWISYLRHLDEYTRAQKTLQQHMRSGFFSLSRANFKARPSVRYGVDYFHNRAVATRRVEVLEDENGGRPKKILELYRHAIDPPRHESELEDTEAKQQPCPPATPEPEDQGAASTGLNPGPKSSNDETSEIESTRFPEKPKPPLESDPLRWYGILIPQELRSAQSSFSMAMDECLGLSINAARSMRETEVEIRKLRKEIRKAEKAEKR